MKKLSFIAAAILIFGFFSQTPLSADESDVQSKLKLISEKQDRILAELDEIKAELKIVKVRTTLNG